MNAFNYVLIAAGAYVLYAAVILKTRGKITKNLMLSPGVSENMIGDREGFARYMFPRTAVLGAAVAFAGGWDVVFPGVAGTGQIELAVIAVFTILLIRYLRAVKKAEKRFANRRKD
ncbi:hypothetical protein [Lachnoclostridium sp. Marseille-P6806]|uniref:hypothetical protein n=1 Tax=Lachnoclostridium sp. Marseille-P6806 TaxID=2364793 RepID=UPI00102FFCF5|nr:hypothetical protein [Lachnoclostridium sp. Marseille-P6806]